MKWGKHMFQLRKHGVKKLIARLFLASLCVLQVLFSVLPTQSVLAVSAPNILNYQGRVLNSNGIPVSDATASMVFELYTAAVAGTCVWSNSSTTCASATARTVTLTDGLFSESLGDTVATYSAISDATFSDNGTLYLQVTVNGETLTPRKQLAAAPYAMNSDTLDGMDADADGATASALVALTSAGNVIFTGDPTGATVSTGVAYINPAAAGANETLLGIADAGTERFRLDREGDVFANGDLALTGGDLTSSAGTFNFLDAAGDSLIIDIGGVSSDLANTINIGTNSTSADSITIGNANASTNFALTGGTSWSMTLGGALTTEGLITTSSDLAVNGGDITSTAGTLTINSASLVELGTDDNFAFSGDLAATLGSDDDFSVNRIQTTDSNIYSGNFRLTNSSATDVGDKGVLNLVNLDDGGVTGETDHGLIVTNLDNNEALVNGITVTNTGTGSITTGLMVRAPTGSIGTGIDLSSTGITDALSVGTNAILGTTGAITYSNFSITGTGTGTFVDLACTDCLDFDSFEDAMNLDAFTFITGGAGEELIIDRALTDATSEIGMTVQVVGSDSTSSTTFQHAMRIVNQPSTEAVDTLLILDNNDGDDLVGRGLFFTVATGGLTTAIDASDADIVTALSTGLNDISGVNYSITGAGVGTFVDLACTNCLDFTEISDTLTLDASTSIALNAAETLSMSNTGTGTAFLITQDTVADATTTATTQALVINVNEAQNNDEVILIVSDADGTPDAEFRFENDGDLFGDGATYNSGADYAEFFYTVDTSLAANDLVCQDLENNLAVKKCELDDETVIGVVSSRPGFVGNNIPGADGSLENNPNYRIIGLEGQIETLATAADGEIEVGDALTASSVIEGYAGKADGAGRVVGFALEPLRSGRGTIMVRVSPGWHGGELDSVSSLLALESLDEATEREPVSDSNGLAFRGSAWDGREAQTLAMTLSNRVTDSDSYRLSVTNNRDSEVAYINNLGDLVLSGKLYPSDQGTAQTSAYVYYDSQGMGYMRTNAAGWGTGSYDFAEMFPSPEALSPGDVVVFGDGAEQVKKSTGETYDDRIAGVVSTRPGFLAGTYKPGDQPIALSGRVPTRVTNENGSIAIGDPLTTSSTAGVAMKASEAGPIVGYAMQPFDEATGMITVFIRASYYDGDGSNTPVFAAAPVSQVEVSGSLTSLSLNGGAITSVASIAGIGNTWSLNENGDLITHGRLVQVVKSHQNEDVETYPVVAREQTVQLSGTVTMNNNMAEVKFDDIDPKFNDILAIDSSYRVLATPAGLTGQIYVTDRTQLGFTVHAESAPDGTLVDWLVIAPHKDAVPLPVVAGETADVEGVEGVSEQITEVEEVVEPVLDELAIEPVVVDEPVDDVVEPVIDEPVVEVVEDVIEEPIVEAPSEPETTPEPEVIP